MELNFFSPIRDKVVVNDRWGINSTGHHGGFFTYADRFDPGKLVERKWENCLTLDRKSWGFRRNIRVIFLGNNLKKFFF